jgi:hypothetical protein
MAVANCTDMKNYKIIAWLACGLVLLSCWTPWAYYADLNKSFNGFFSEKNMYGKPGILFSFIAIFSALLIPIDKIWAKRTNIIVAAINLGYLIKTYILFTSCYNAYCPEKKFGIYLLIAGSVLLIITAFFPDTKLAEKK